MPPYERRYAAGSASARGSFDELLAFFSGDLETGGDWWGSLIVELLLVNCDRNPETVI